MASTPPSKKARLSPSPAEPTPATPFNATNPDSTNVSQTSAEVAVGITEYVNPTLPSWTGVLKQRYTDFLVNEVDEDGVVVHLKSTRPPRAAPKESKEDVEKKDDRVNSTKAEPVAVAETPADALAQLSAVVPADVAESIVSLAAADVGTTDKLTTPPIATKDDRSAFHGLIRTLFSGRLVTEATTSDPPAITIQRATPTTAASERRRSKRGGKNHKNSSWADLGGEYCHFTLYKENRDTMEVLNLLARLLKLRGGGKSFSFAGTKDRRAVTAQRCAAHMVKAERLAGLNKAGDGGLRGARLGDFEYKPHGLQLGDLRGNEFVITLRQAESTQEGVSLEDAVKTCVDSVRATGFANYYGLQRFGSFDVTTSDVGTYLLRTDWRGAIEKILQFNPALCGESKEEDRVARDERERAEACDIFFTTYDFEKASNTMPRKYVAESAILRYFKERGMRGDGNGKGLDYLGAIQAIPRGLRIMYAHAYQSLVWNNVTSARLRMSSTQVLPGDLVLVENKKKEVVEEVDQDGEVVIAPSASTDVGESDFQRARVLSAEEAASGQYTMADVVLSTPGWDIEYPANEALMAVYKDVMAKDGLNPHDMKRSVRDWSLTGSYRKVLSRFVDDECSYEVRKCKVGEQVVGTDLEAIEAASTGEKRKRSEEDGDVDVNMEEASEEEMVVVLRMRLGTSCYATMALRELMKGGVRAYKPEFGR